MEALSLMFEKRGYTEVEKNDNTIISVKPDGDQVCGFCDVVIKLNIAQVHAHIKELQSMEINHGVIIYLDKPTPAVKKALIDSKAIGIYIEIFKKEDISYVPIFHRLVPKHELVTDEKEIAKIKKIARTLPTLKLDDIISRYYNFEKGNIVKIHRKNKFEDAIVYRIVR